MSAQDEWREAFECAYDREAHAAAVTIPRLQAENTRLRAALTEIADGTLRPAHVVAQNALSAWVGETNHDE